MRNKFLLLAASLLAALTLTAGTASATVGTVASIPAGNYATLTGGTNCGRIATAKIDWQISLSTSILANLKTVNCSTNADVAGYFVDGNVRGWYYNPGVSTWLNYCTQPFSGGGSPIVSKSCPPLFSGTSVTVSVDANWKNSGGVSQGTTNVTAWGGVTG